MRVLIGCESSGTVRRAFRALGHDAWSNDILPAAAGSEHHLQMDVFDAIRRGPWDLAIFHPPCTYLTLAQVRWYTQIPKKPKPGILYGAPRVQAASEAVEFVKRLYDCNIPKVAIENPKGILSTRWRKPDQTMQPWHFGYPEFKGIGLWLKNLPLLQPTNQLTPPKKGTPEFNKWSKVHFASPGPDRWKIRSKTYDGLAAAFSLQWGIDAAK